ncbi:MAG: competence/damage-inducible protein A [Rickettsiales bacterium]|nr:competence/damage-inducible protein A [Rickettsiales bacterium]
MNQEKTAAFIVIGNEILSGRTNDENINFLTHNLTEIGINVKEVVIIEDDEKQIIYHVNRLKTEYNYVFTSGGIGPTHDDITAASIAKALNKKLILDEEAHKILQKHYNSDELNDARLKMAILPEGSILLDNPVSSAPGFKIENIFVFAGVPIIMQAMLKASMEFLETGPKKLSKTVNIALPESVIAKKISEISNKYDDLDIGSYPFIANGKLGTAIVFRSIDAEIINLAHTEYLDYLTNEFGDLAKLNLKII